MPIVSPVQLKVERDSYQARYMRHQEKKKHQLMFGQGAEQASLPDAYSLDELLSFRRSQRVFDKKEISEAILQKILATAETAPSSCNRHGLKLKVIRERDDKELLGGILVGGAGWVHRADTIILFLADPEAYASPRERDFMHYCDVGFTAMGMWLTAETLGIGAAYINPNLSHPDVMAFKYSSNLIFCGALALGYYTPQFRAETSEPGNLKDMLV